MSERKKVTAYIDGSCIGNPGPGGWGALVAYGEHRKEFFGGEEHTTNNRMELMAAIQVFEHLRQEVDITLITDSVYLKNGITTWLHAWKKNNWRTKNKKTVRNKDLWLRLDELAGKHVTHWRWVKGHSGDAGNEMADMLAKKGAQLARNGQ